MTSWHRLERVIKWTGLSINSFAINVGLKRSENLYQIKKGNNRISRDLADSIAAKYPSISKGWLLSGEGEMFVEAKQHSGQGVPFFAVNAISAVTQRAHQAPLYYIDIPSFRDCDFAAIALGSAMSPDILPGAIVVLKEWPVDSIIPGESYLVIANFFKGIRTIRLSEELGKIRLLPSNLEAYDHITIDCSDIEFLFIVRGIIMNKIT